MLNGSDKVSDADASAASPKSQTVKRKLKPAKRKLVQSTIGFPYRDLEVGVSVALAIMGAGGVALTSDQLAGVMGLQTGSGNFVLKVMTARMFGLIANVGGKYELTNLGFAVVDKDEKRKRAALAEAFLKVPLYKRVFDEFRGKQLPPRPHGLEQAFIRFGVSEKQRQNARLAFDKSAQQAGFFSAGNDKLIEPILGSVPPMKPPTIDDGGGNGNGRPASAESIGPDVSGFHPFIQGLLDTLPEPQTVWAVEGRAKWLQAAANIFDLIYQGDGAIQITAIQKDSSQ